MDDVAHGKRVGIMALECGRVLNMGKNERSFLFEPGLLHDVGVSSTRTHKHLIDEFDWEGSQQHADTGCVLLSTFAPFAHGPSLCGTTIPAGTRLKALRLEPHIARQAN